MAIENKFLSVQVLYQLSWNGKLEHPHMIDVEYASDQGGLRLRDVKERLTRLRGHGINDSFSWSYKRTYRKTFIWNDLCDDDVIYPLCDSGEYVLRASELIDTSDSKSCDVHSRHSNERLKSSLKMFLDNATSKQGNIGDDLHFGALKSGDDRLSVDTLNCLVRKSGANLEEVKSMRGATADISQNLPTLAVDQEIMDVEKSDFCLSSSDNEISPRPKMTVECIKPVKAVDLVVKTKSPTVYGVQTPPSPSLKSSTEPPLSPGGTKRLWRKEIRKSLFRTRNSSNVNSASTDEITPVHVELPPICHSTLEDSSFWRDSQSKSSSPSSPDDSKDVHIDKEEVEQSTSQLIRLLWARWTGGSSKSKRIFHNTCEGSSTKISESKRNLPHRTKSPTKESRATYVVSSDQEIHQSLAVQSKPRDSLEIMEVLPQECKHYPSSMTVQSVTEFASPLTQTDGGGDICAIKTIVSEQASQQCPEPRNLRTDDVVLSVKTPGSHITVLEGLTSDNPSGPSEVHADTPLPAAARAKLGNSLSKLKTTEPPKPLPPGFHKGTNDTKPVQTTPKRTPRNSSPLASPPFVRSFSRDAVRGLSSLAAISLYPDKDSVAFAPSPEKTFVKKRINYREREEMPLIPGLTTLDWEKALQEATTNCLPPPNFRDILQECSICRRTFKPDSLQVHMRGCHPPQYARAFSARASPHVSRY